jgi:hypothetical protein
MASFLNFFAHAQCMAALAALLSWGLRTFSRKLRLTSISELKAQYALFALFVSLLFWPFLHRGSFEFHPVAHVEAGRDLRGMSFEPSAVVKLPGAEPKSPGIPIGAFSFLALVLTLAGTAIAAKEYLQLRRLLTRVIPFRQIGHVRIAVAEGVSSPLSTRGLVWAWVLVPPAFLTDPLSMRLAISHELQHHRARDTIWCHAFAGLRALCFFHPLRVLWAAVVAETQEMACDEVLVRQKRRISAADYSRCLIRAAELAAREGEGRAYAAALGFSFARSLLVRRIETMFETKKQSRWIVPVLGLIAGVSLAGGAWASGQWVVDTRITEQKMEKMAAEARKGTDFPIEVNELVLHELNYYIGTAAGRDFIAKAKERLAALRPMLDRELKEHRVPEELLAVGLIESGFQNLPQGITTPTNLGAGVWQFIPNSARRFGLRVDEVVDERLSLEKETDAAFRYLASNQLQFNDWLLGIMAYNLGENAVDNAISQSGTRDPWELVRHGLHGDNNYLARFMAAVLILKSNEKYR